MLAPDLCEFQFSNKCRPTLVGRHVSACSAAQSDGWRNRRKVRCNLSSTALSTKKDKYTQPRVWYGIYVYMKCFHFLSDGRKQKVKAPMRTVKKKHTQGEKKRKRNRACFFCFLLFSFCLIDKSQEHGINLSRSQQQGYSTAYNTQFHIQVVCKGSVFPRVFHLQMVQRRATLASRGPRYTRTVPGVPPSQKREKKRHLFLLTPPGKAHIVASSMDSGLEAFSHNPADGSLAPSAFQPGANTKYLNQQFLSYCVELLSRQQPISRVKLTCLTTV